MTIGFSFSRPTIKGRFGTSLLLLCCTLFLPSILHAQNNWSSWETLYKDNDVTVEIQFKSFPCNQHRKTKFRYNVTGKLASFNKNVYWKLEYRDCMNNIQVMNNHLPIGGQDALLGSVESTSFMFKGEITKRFFDVGLNPTTNNTPTATAGWEPWETLYKDNDVTVEIQFNYAQNPCANGGKRSKYRYRISGQPVTDSKYVSWKLSYYNCNQNLISVDKKIQIGGAGAGTGIIEAMDYDFLGTISGKPSNVYAYNSNRSVGTTSFPTSSTPRARRWSKGQKIPFTQEGSSIVAIDYHSRQDYINIKVVIGHVPRLKRVNIDLYYSIDGGNTFPYKLKEKEISAKGGEVYYFNCFEVVDEFNKHGNNLVIKVIATEVALKNNIYLSYHGDSRAPIGFRLGHFITPEVGIYLSGRASRSAFRKVEYSADLNTGVQNYAGSSVIGNKERIQRYALMAGVSLKVHDFLHPYVGIGYSRTRTLWNFHTLSNNVQTGEEWAYVKELEFSGLEYEAGLMVTTNHLLFNAGVTCDQRFNHIRPSFGLGVYYMGKSEPKLFGTTSSSISAPFGGMFGFNSNFGLGAYVSARRSFRGNPKYYVDNQGLYTYDNSENKTYEHEGNWSSQKEDKTYRYSCTAGLTFRINEYVQLYSGLGIGGRKTLLNYSYLPQFSNSDDTGYAIDETTEIKRGVELEGGIIFQIHLDTNTFLLLNAGLTSLKGTTPELTFGVGLAYW